MLKSNAGCCENCTSHCKWKSSYWELRCACESCVNPHTVCGGECVEVQPCIFTKMQFLCHRHSVLLIGLSVFLHKGHSLNIPTSDMVSTFFRFPCWTFSLFCHRCRPPLLMINKLYVALNGSNVALCVHMLVYVSVCSHVFKLPFKPSLREAHFSNNIRYIVVTLSIQESQGHGYQSLPGVPSPQTFQHPFNHPSSSCYPIQGHRGWSLSLLSQGVRLGSPWTDLQADSEGDTTILPFTHSDQL